MEMFVQFLDLAATIGVAALWAGFAWQAGRRILNAFAGPERVSLGTVELRTTGSLSPVEVQKRLHQYIGPSPARAIAAYHAMVTGQSPPGKTAEALAAEREFSKRMQVLASSSATVPSFDLPPDAANRT